MKSDLVDALLGVTLTGILRAVASFQTEELEICDSLVFVTNRGSFQLQSDVHQKTFRRMSAPDDVVIEGDYQDRTGLALRSLNILDAPFVVAAIHLVSEVLEKEEHLVGALLADDRGDLRLGVNFHLDDVDAVHPNVLWEYIGRLVPNSRTITIGLRPQVFARTGA